MTVYLVGAGPGDADLLTVRAARLLGAADVVVRDRLIDASVMAYVNPSARVYDVGKEPGDSSTQDRINALLIREGLKDQTVVRLKGGDPFVFGRGGEELVALRNAGVACAVVPGVSSALSAPAAAGIPVTHRGLSRGVTIVTGTGSDGLPLDVGRFASDDTTLVILMGVAHRRALADHLMSEGMDPTRPVAVIERAWTGSQRTVRGELATLAELEVNNPAVIVIGEVAALELCDSLVSDLVLLP